MPKNKLFIEIDHPRDVYSSNDIITGQLTLKIYSTRFEFQKIVIELLGISETKIITHANNVSVSTHLLMEFNKTLFPDDEVLKLNGNYTLNPGTYNYPFHIQLPGDQDSIQCLKHKRNSCGFVQSPENLIITIPPSFEYHLFDEFAKINYTLMGQVINANFFQTNLKSFKLINFKPTNDGLTYSLNHLINIRSKRLIKNVSVSEYYFKFLNGKKNKKGVFDKLLDKHKTSLPLQLACEFKPFLKQVTSKGESNRFFTSGMTLGELIKINLVCPFSSNEFKETLNNSTPELIIKRLKISMLQLITYNSSVTKNFSKKIELLNNASLSLQLKLDSFIETSGEDYPLCNVTPIKSLTYDSSKSYLLELPNEWFSKVKIPELPPSFICCNIKNEYLINIKLGLVIKQGSSITKLKSIKLFTPVVGLGELGGVPEYEEEQLPAYFK